MNVNRYDSSVTLRKPVLLRGLALLCLMVGWFGTVAGAQTLTVLTHDSFAISEEVIAAFTEQTGIEVEFLAAGDAGELVNRAVLTKGNPLGDVLYGVDNSFLTRALNEGIFAPYLSPALANVEQRYWLSPEGYVTPVDVGYVNFNLDRGYFETQQLALPTDITDLTTAAYRGLTVVQNPATSSPGLAFMLATIDRFGMPGAATAEAEGQYGWLEYWADLRDNDVQVTSGWSDAYYTAFSLYGGDRPVVLSYATSPAAEVMFAETPLDDAPSLNLFCEACAYQQIEAAGILAGSKHIEAAKAFIDFMLSPSFQTDIPGNMFVYPVLNGTNVPAEFVKYGKLPVGQEIATLASGEIEGNLSVWLKQWTQVVEQGQSPADVYTAATE